VILVYDVTDRSTFESVSGWIDQIHDAFADTKSDTCTSGGVPPGDRPMSVMSAEESDNYDHRHSVSPPPIPVVLVGNKSEQQRRKVCI